MIDLDLDAAIAAEEAQWAKDKLDDGPNAGECKMDIPQKGYSSR